MHSLTRDLPPSDARQRLALAIQEKQRRQVRNRLKGYRPHRAQLEFHANGQVRDADGCERLFMAGNQQGKTWCGGSETAMHATGRYPDWWPGATFDRAPKIWVAGVTGESTRDNPQRILIGQPQFKDQWGTGSIPYDCLQDWTMGRGMPDALDSAVISWGGGGDVQASQSVIMFKSYEKGREKWQGDTVDCVWFDEEPPSDIYSEGRTRTQLGQRGKFTMITFTPLLGLSEVVRQFLDADQVKKMSEAA